MVIEINTLRKYLNEQLGCYSFCSKGGRDLNRILESIQTQSITGAYSATWLHLDGYWHRVRCSACGKENVRKTPFCPSCGAKMDIE